MASLPVLAPDSAVPEQDLTVIKAIVEIRSAVLRAAVSAARRADLIFHQFSAMTFSRSLAAELKAGLDNAQRLSADKIYHIICGLIFWTQPKVLKNKSA